MNKLMEASMALLQATPDQQLNIVVLNKALFYADLCALRDLGHTITEQKYLAFEQGPVVASYNRRIVDDLIHAGLAQQLQVGKAKPMKVVRPLEQYSLLDANELKITSEFGRAMSKFTSLTMSNFSHENPGWIIGNRRRLEGKPSEIDMRIALQQIAFDDEDPWIDAAPDGDLLALIEEAGTATTRWT